jgi:hypothetical protein
MMKKKKDLPNLVHVKASQKLADRYILRVLPKRKSNRALYPVCLSFE